MKDDLDTAHRPRQGIRIAQIADDQIDVAGHVGEIGAAAAREIVEDAHPGSVGKQSPREMRSDEAEAAGDQGFHTGRYPRHRSGVTRGP